MPTCKKLERCPDKWGPGTWYLIHCAAKCYPCNPSDSDKAEMHHFLNSLGPILPCKKCRGNYMEYLKAHPPALSCKRAFKKWTYNLHDSVNKRLGKKSPPFEEVFRD